VKPDLFATPSEKQTPVDHGDLALLVPSPVRVASRYIAKEKYPWDKCIEDQLEEYGDKETAEKVCGAIRAKSQFGKK
jgi:hypothetical protein